MDPAGDLVLCHLRGGLLCAGLPFGYYMAAQGALIVYVVLIFVYAKKMNAMDREYNVHEEG